MADIGYALSSEEHPPADLVRYAQRAEASGFPFALISDHFHPWIDKQGHSPFVWSVLGAIGHATKTLRIGTGVTCPMIRTHPAVIAQAAATTAVMMPGRFFLGVGTGENLNEHITGAGWPAADQRREMLAESIDVMRKLWTGDLVTHRGEHYTVEQARLYTVPDAQPDIYMAAGGEKAAMLAGTIADGFIGTSPDADAIATFRDAGGGDKPTYGQVTVCYAADEAEARKTAHAWWPNAALAGELTQELPLPRHFEQAAESVTEEQVAEKIPCGPDASRHIDAIQKYIDAGYSHVYLHQVGPDQDGFFRFYEEQVLPKIRLHKAA